MRFSWNFLQNMLENGHSNLQTNLWVHITSNIFKISNSKSRDRTNHPPPPDLPTLRAYPTPGVGGRFGIFSLKWRERMNLKVPGSILPLGCAILSTRAKTVRGVGTTPSLGELGLSDYQRNCPKFHVLTQIVILKVYLERDRLNFFFLINFIVIFGSCEP